MNFDFYTGVLTTSASGASWWASTSRFCGLGFSRNKALMEWLKHLAIKYDGEGVLVNNWKQGKRYAKYPNGLLEYEWNYEHGQRHGIQRSWYDNGRSWYEWNYEHEQPHGIQRGWYKSGKLSYEENCDRGQRHGIQLDWFENSKFLFKQNYINGVLQN